ncbi:sulfate/thiosulfate import ATP-binding protein, putative [Actinidia rufa]|uniref:Sulfate/thiosulfate import ATP-binding protein, putative n=1 Tax=Actinidia rufa TaxID=165716 RepID=A0A7J0HAF2_9ERIC|nr:sulfate/thiosulfate import ATP-binding protein, putative [Actinidia rufa]
MAGFSRAKRVTDPLDDKVKARIVGKVERELVYISSGSEHSGENDDDESPCLSDLVHGFLEDDAGRSGESPEYDSDSERDPAISDPVDVIDDLVNPAVTINADSFRNVLLGHVNKAMAVFWSVTSNKSVLRRNVMTFLRNFGYNAAICKSKWETSGGLTSGCYEFIDVLRSDSARYFIDLDFAGEFAIARPTNHYDRMFQTLPRVFVGRSEELKQIVKVMSDAAKRSLKSRGLSLPPWRKNRYMQNKWFGSYRRTANVFPSMPPPANRGLSQSSAAPVGFDAVDGRLPFPATSRTR